MSKTIIKVENLSKRYRIGLKEEKAQTFAEQLVRTLKYPIQNFRQIRNLGKFGQEEEGVHWALKDVSFEVKEGEVLGIIGKNGAGKSTLLKILSRITEPTSGRITVEGRIAALLEVGTGFHPELTGRENIYMNGTILGMTKKEIDRKLDEIIDFSGIEKFVDTPIKFYSSGMKVRLGFSVAAHLDPEILVIDEVLAVGDYEFQQKCLGKMENVSKQEGRTVLFVSHNMSAVRKLCNKAIILKDGLLSEVGTTDAVVKKYLNEYRSTTREVTFSDSHRNDFIQPLRLYLESKEEIITVNDQFNIWFEFLNMCPNSNINLSLVIATQDDIVVFNSISNSVPLVGGKAKFKCQVPANLLNNQIYTLRVLVVKDLRIPLLDISDVINFEIADGERSINWFGEWSGTVRPNLEWEIFN
ncbi:Teichoic acid export ATP-binding protein TagH [Mariniradius saccharolyticus AK6]|uniref:Teichoic acid export ATP-binding protein TagH n=1 Tax=Mariniradius saccharolyticus AK6 TaxID=1239962 RepID=M7XV03_9BACT|nr:polysaccharide ABC transporter ATP-binding protein [Mariniradius saccharolyticus]EMS32312.1 Teichoic acid export ATP-binding protein TagH [Mariniradius saccharolyticus AK6]